MLFVHNILKGGCERHWACLPGLYLYSRGDIVTLIKERLKTLHY